MKLSTVNTVAASLLGLGYLVATLVTTTVTPPTTPTLESFSDRPTTVLSTKCPQGVQGFYNTRRNDITMCLPVGHPEYASTYRHEFQHYLQDKQDGLDNNTVETVSSRATLAAIWNYLYKTNSPLYRHITKHYHPSHWLIELEAYLLQDSPESTTFITIEQ